MAEHKRPNADSISDPIPYSRDRLKLIALLFIAGLGIVLTVVVAGPFIPGLTWGLAFAVVASPLHYWLSSRVGRPDLSAGLSVTMVALVLLLPLMLVGWKVAAQATEVREKFEKYTRSDELEQSLQNSPKLARAWSWIETHVNVEQELKDLGESIQRRVPRWAKSVVWGTIQILVALFALFYFLRDRDQVIGVLRSLMPLSDKETDYFFDRVKGMTHATIYGTLVVAAIQGTLGGLMFWILGVPAALLWGFAMGVLAIIPVAGAFVIWMPAALFLGFQGNWWEALILAGWGLLVVSTIDNLLYPMLVGKEMRLHTLPVFIAIVGGLFLFGAAGLVIGPVILAGTVALLDILRSRTAYGRSAETPT